LDSTQRINQKIATSIETQVKLAEELSEEISLAGEHLVQCLLQDGKFLICGNGVSASIAQAFTSHLLNHFEHERPSLPALCLCSSHSTTTAIATDNGFNEIYSYKDTDKYLFDLFQFDKNVILLVNAKAQISYDLSQMDIQLDSVHKIIKIVKIPKEQVEIFPEIKYYDLQQSTLNQFNKDDLNKINQDAIERIKSHIDLAQLRLKAKKQLLENLQNLYILSKVYGWKVEDNHLMRNLKSDLLM